MTLAKLLLLLVQAGATLAAPAQAGHGVAVRDGAGDAKCVDGSPTETGGFVIFYQQVAPASPSETGYIIDPAWQSRHQTVGGPTHLSVSGPSVPYGEFKCQYSCNGLPGCVSYAAYEGKGFGNSNEMTCYFFDALIRSHNIVPKPAAGNSTMTHAYDRLCHTYGG